MTEAEIEKKWENTVWDTDIYLDDLDGKEQMTNEEWLRSLNTEELAEYLADKFNEVVDFVLHEVDENAEDIEPDDYWYRQDVIVEWLKQPHTNS